MFMKKKFFLISLSILLLSIGGCSSNTNEEEATNVSSEKTSTIESTTEEKKDSEKPSISEDSETNESSVQNESDQSVVSSTKDSSTESDEKDSTIKEDINPLSEYTNEQIEYARIWLQLGPNQDIDGLYIKKISKGSKLNPDDEYSAIYPEDVIQLAGSRLVDGSITYKSNGNGTIVVYKVPQRWDYSPITPEIVDGVSLGTKQLLEDTYQVEVNTGNPEDIKSLIEIEQVQ